MMQHFTFYHRLTMVVALLWLTTLATYAQGQLSEAIGNYQSMARQPGNVYAISGANIQMQVQFVNAAIVRVRYAKPGQAFETTSFAVVSVPQNDLKITQTEDAAALTFRTDSLKLVVRKQPIRVQLFNSRDVLLNEDEPAFGTSYIGEEVTTYKKLQPGERFIGLGEKTGPLNRRGEGYTNWNTDAFGYGAGQDPIYQSIPFYIGLHNNVQYGCFMDNSFKSHYSFGATNERFCSFTAEAGEMDYYLIAGRTVGSILNSYTFLTGRSPLPPLWGLGLQQARYSYYPEQEVRTLAKTYRDKNIPADGIVLDIHYMDKYKIFTWDKSRFSNPKQLTDDLKAQGFHTITIHDPGIKVEPGYKGYDDGLAADLFAKYPDGTYHVSNVWPGRCHFPEFGRKKTSDYWKASLKYSYTDNGVEGFWNDMNEPASWGNRFPNIVNFRYDDAMGKEQTMSHRRMHNIYGLLMSKTSYEAGRELLGKRPFILTRAGYAGIQRYSAVWTGDNRSEDDHMMSGVRLLNSMGLSGVPYTGMDVGGFTGNPSPALFARWMSIGAFSPFYRIHSAINTKEADPWSFGEEVEAICKNYIRLRYRLLPYLYSTFAEASATGMPVNRSLAITASHDNRTYSGAYHNQFFHGPALLVCPSESKDAFTRVFLPEGPGTYYDLYNDKPYAAGAEYVVESPVKQLPVFVRGGSVMPMQKQVLHTGEAAGDTLFLHCYNGNRQAPFVYYEDDGASFDNEKGVYLRRIIALNGATKSLVFEKAEGSYASKFTQVKVILHGFDAKARGREERNAFVEPMPNFDPIGSGQAAPGSMVRTFTVPMPGRDARVEIKL
jgi:alpha-glucosidase